MNTSRHTGFTLIERFLSLRAQAKQSRTSSWIAASAHRPPRNDGFTLIELSIVLVIIGLIVGGVLVGQDLIQAAKVRSAISSIREYDVAAMAFRNKYNCLPGDCVKAVQFGFQARNAANGDKVIGSFFAADNGESNTGFEAAGYFFAHGSGGDESQLFWSDLFTAGLIGESIGPGDPSGLTIDKVSPKLLGDAFIVAAHGALTTINKGGFGYTFVGYPASTGNTQVADYLANLHFTPLSTAEAYSIDSKIDDANPLSGKVYTLNTLPIYLSVVNKGALAGCSTDSGGGVGTYDVANTVPNVCVIKIKGAL